ncbi:sugar phosphate nucleotidyltransferase [Nitrospira lenta]|uniref:Putative Mannose-1-phosphate guanylyltransferase (GDP) n=1 Tax=Nitrospira lenta TaxID=1436998 RepID=A0A330LB77_9BACT|nr:sugar phosphate nucleotidyltransferase [Nitrospira lenta]SPP66344.1 putative Mannose-1-phosphate guanylyltransferase (GDP) [Nitrospira lenta]
MESRESRSARAWSVILAGGEGERVRPLIERWLGRHKPKQYCTFVGSRSMFQHTVDRATRLTPPKRTVAVVARGHRPDALAQLKQRGLGTLVLQPENRDTAAGIFLPLTYVRARDPDATVVIYPSDHFVYPESRFLDVVLQATGVAESLPDRILLLGVMPDRLELEYGWILPGEILPAGGLDANVQAVRAFIEKPTVAQADAALARRALWNTFVMVSKISTLWELGRQCFPDLIPLFERLEHALDTSEEGRVLNSIYEAMPTKNFSSDLLQLVPECVAVMELTGVLWSDWGKPERIVETLRRIAKTPAFPPACLDQPFAPMPVVEGERSVAANV